MKKHAASNKAAIAIALILSFFAFGTTSAQKMGYVDTEYILQNIPEYQDAQNEIEEYSKQWQEEIEEKYSQVEQMYKDYQVDAVLLPEDLRQRREQEIIDFEREIKDLQKQRFGSDGELFKKRQELIKPIQEKIFNAIEEIATKKNYAFIFDKAGGPVIMFVDSKYDISDEVLDQIGSIMGVRGN
ncbi:MAG: OmpH family outer membrane protein [Bacteroidales bacterium]|nr:OmpH family outer membrane protein [Bacteroidales bacterium]